jgi:hypothetical protein
VLPARRAEVTHTNARAMAVSARTNTSWGVVSALWLNMSGFASITARNASMRRISQEYRHIQIVVRVSIEPMSEMPVLVLR